MKKILLFVVALMSATMMQAGLGLSVEGNVIERDTTITIAGVEYDDFTGEPVMSWKGQTIYKGQLIVFIERTTPCVEGYEDQLCAGECKTGSTAQLRDTMNFNTAMYTTPFVQVYAHYYPQSKSVETIKYRFVGGGDDFTLTVKYDASAMAVEQVVDTKKSVKVIRNGQVIIVRDGVEYNALGAKL